MFQRIFGSTKKSPSSSSTKPGKHQSTDVPSSFSPPLSPRNGRPKPRTATAATTTARHVDTTALAAAISSDPVPQTFRSPAVILQKSSPLLVHQTHSNISTPGFSNGSFTHDRAVPVRGSPIALTQSRSAPQFRGTGSFAGSDVHGNTVNYWHLPWSPQRVVMCPYCHRPQQQVPVGGYGSLPGARSEASSRSSCCSDSSDSCQQETYCRCGTRGADDLHASQSYTSGALKNDNSMALSTSSHSAAYTLPPVFIVETQRSACITVPGTLAEDGSSSEDEDDNSANPRTSSHVKLSLVTPLTSHSLRMMNPPQQIKKESFSSPHVHTPCTATTSGARQLLGCQGTTVCEE